MAKIDQLIELLRPFSRDNPADGAWLAGQLGVRGSRAVRAIVSGSRVELLRRSGEAICSDDKTHVGYWLARDLEDFLIATRQLDRRVRQMSRAGAGMKAEMKRRFAAAHQQSLPLLETTEANRP